MAIYPCDAHGQRYQGAQQTIYPALIVGADTERRKMRLCPVCFTQAETWIGSHLHDVADPEETTDCALCGKADAGASIFTTVYAKGSERVDYFGRVCEGDCLGTARVALFGATAGS